MPNKCSDKSKITFAVKLKYAKFDRKLENIQCQQQNIFYKGNKIISQQIIHYLVIYNGNWIKTC